MLCVAIFLSLLVLTSASADPAKIATLKAAGVFSAAEPGKWLGKEGKHAPQLLVKHGVAKVVTPHGQADDHFIDLHW